MKNSIKLESALTNIAEASAEGHFHNSALRYIRFVFCDDQPSGNGFGVEHEDFPVIMASAIGTPIKMRFMGAGIGNHLGSVPIGHITGMTENTVEENGNTIHQIIADGIVFAEDYPDETEWLEDQMALASEGKGDAPTLSFEMGYESTAPKNGTNWLKGLTTKAIAFVRNAAYGKRASLLALASDSSLNDEEFADGLIAIANEVRPKNSNKGGNITVDEKEKEKLTAEIEDLRAQLTAATTKIEELTTANASLNDEKTALAEKITEHETALAEAARKELISKRTAEVAEAGATFDGDRLAKKQEFWASLDEGSWTEYLEDIKELAAAAKKEPATKLASLRVARASAEPTQKLVPDAGTPSSLDDLRGRFRTYARTVETE